MRRRLVYIIVFVIVLMQIAPLKIYAQNDLLIKENSDIYFFNVVNDQKHEYSNEAFSRLASFWKTPPEQLSFTIEYTYQVEGVSKDNGAEFFVSINQLKINENPSHHGIGLDDVLVPDRVDFSVFVYLNQGALVGVYDFKSIEFSKSGSPKALIKVSDFDASHLTCKLGKTDFYHSKDALDRFLYKTSLINRYFTEKVEIKAHMKRLEKLQYTGGKSILTNHSSVLLAEYFVNNGFNKVVTDLKLAENNDPLGVLPSFEKLRFLTSLALDACSNQREKYYNNHQDYDYVFTNFVLNQIEENFRQDKLTEALALVECLSYYCRVNKLDYFPQSYFSQKKEEIEKGLLDAYLRVANQALEAGLFDLALNYQRRIIEEFSDERTLQNQHLISFRKKLVDYKMGILQRYFNADNTDLALDLLGEIDELSASFMLSDYRSEIDSFYQKLYQESNPVSNEVVADAKPKLQQVKISDKELRKCKKNKEQYANLIRKAEIKINASDFLGADYLLQQAVSLKQKGRCNFNDLVDATEILASIKTAVKFQNLLLDINQYANTENYDLLISTYKKAGDIYLSANLQNKGLYLIEMIEYARIKGELDFYKTLADYYMNQGQFDLALQALYEIYQKDASGEDIVRLQELLAARMAIADHKSEPDANPKRFLKAYVNGDKWFKPFRETYLMIWKTS